MAILRKFGCLQEISKRQMVFRICDDHHPFEAKIEDGQSDAALLRPTLSVHTALFDTVAVEQTRCGGNVSCHTKSPLPSGRGVPLRMSRIHPECGNTVPPGRSRAADALLRQEPDEGEDERDDEEEDDGDDKEDEDEDDPSEDGYSE
jgi:hypothetical protein